MLKDDMRERLRVREERRIEESINAIRAASGGYLVASTLNGGTTGQVLTKNSATARDWAWQPAGGSSSVVAGTAITGTAVGASGAAVTLTIAAPGVGLRHYLTYLSINRFAVALLTAGAAPVTVTTTNIATSLAFSFAADAAAAGTLDRWREDFAYPLGVTAQNTATTIVCPATTNVLWRVTAGWYVAP